MEAAAVTCPTCFEVFEVVIDDSGESTFQMDYDCEICCRPMTITVCNGYVEAIGLDDL